MHIRGVCQGSLIINSLKKINHILSDGTLVTRLHADKEHAILRRGVPILMPMLLVIAQKEEPEIDASCQQ